MFIVYLGTEFHMPNSDAHLLSPLKPKLSTDLAPSTQFFIPFVKVVYSFEELSPS
jgi:hypothetical protein